MVWMWLVIQTQKVLEQTPEGELDYRFYNSKCVPKDSFKFDIPTLLVDSLDDYSKPVSPLDDEYILKLIKKLLKSNDFLISESAISNIAFYVEAFNSDN